MKTVLWIVTSLLVTSVVNSQTQRPPSNDDKCTIGQYVMGMSSCWMPYSLSLVGVLMKAVPTQPPRPIERRAADAENSKPAETGSSSQVAPGSNPSGYILALVMQAFNKSCGRPLDEAIECHARLDENCGYRLIDTDILKSTIKSICENLNLLGQVHQCANTNYVPTGILACLSSHAYSGDICVLTKSLRGCITNVVSTCPDTIKKMIGNAFDTISLTRCTNASSPYSGTCTGIASVMTSAMCYVRPVVNVIMLGYSMGMKSSFDMQCRLNETKKAIKCHEDVQRKCNIQYINTNELMMVETQACKHYNDLEKMGQCLDSKDGWAFLNCINTIKLEKSNMLCHATNEYHDCFNKTFDGNFCQGSSDGIRSTMQAGFQTLTLPCPEKKTNPQCSLLEHGTTLALCWYTSVQTMVPWTTLGQPNYNPLIYLQRLCGTNRKLLNASLECHIKSDEKCGYGLLREVTLKGMVNSMCSNIMYMTSLDEIATCIPPAMNDYVKCAMKIRNFDPTDDDYFCKVGKHMQTCMNTMVSNCGKYIKKMVDETMELMEEDLCTIGDEITSRKTTRPMSTTFKTTRGPTGGVKNKHVSLAMATSLVFALNANLNGFMANWMSMLSLTDSMPEYQ